MQAIILCGGLGSRLRPFTFTIPKPLIPVKEKPILEHLILNLKSHGVTEIILAVGYQAELIRSYFNDGKKLGVSIKYSEEKEPLGTVGALGVIKDQFTLDDDVFVMNADTLTKLDFKKMMQFHKDHNSALTIGSKIHDVTIPLGVMEVEGEKVVGIKEKPKLSFTIATGIYVLNKDAISAVSKGRMDMPELIEKLISNGTVMSYQFSEYWHNLKNITHLDEIEDQL